MIPRGRLDIEWSTLIAAAMRSVVRSRGEEDLCRRVEQEWEGEHAAIVCQSVRSGMDCLLTAKEWPAGSEILMSAVTIPEMALIVREHQLVAIPVDVDPDSLAPDLEQLKARITSRTRAIIVAHLFGSRLDLRELAKIARDHHLLICEDVAQGFAADGFRGDIESDVSFFSFGMIKARTALGGAILRFRDHDLAMKCRAIQTGWPLQSAQTFRRKIVRSMLLRTVANHGIFTMTTIALRSLGIDFDEWLSKSARGFAPTELFDQLRKCPCAGLVDLLRRRLQDKSHQWLDQKTALADDYCRQLPKNALLGKTARFPTRWVMPIISRDAAELVFRLRRRGFDATRKASQMRAIPPSPAYPDWTTPLADDWVSRIVFLPLHPALRTKHIREISSIVHQSEAEQQTTIT